MAEAEAGATQPPARTSTIDSHRQRLEEAGKTWDSEGAGPADTLISDVYLPEL